MARISRHAYASMFGPTVGDRVRLADTDLFIRIERDLTTYGEEGKFGGGKGIIPQMHADAVTRYQWVTSQQFTQFYTIGKLVPAALLYIRFGGGDEPGEVRDVSDNVPALVEQAERQLANRIAAFDLEDTPYRPRIKPFRADLPGEYDHLARVL